MGSQPPSEPSPGWGPPSGPPVQAPGPSGTTRRAPGRRASARRGPGRPRDARAAQNAAKMVGRFALLVLASLLCSNLRLPWQAAALLFSVPGVVVGVLAVRAVVRAGLRGPVVALTGAGVVMAGLMVLGQVGLLVFWPLTARLQECQDGALTQSAKRQCMQDYERRLNDLTQLGRRGS